MGHLTLDIGLVYQKGENQALKQFSLTSKGLAV